MPDTGFETELHGFTWLDDLAALGGLAFTSFWVVKTVREADLPALFAQPRPVVTGEVYEPIPDEVIRSM